MKKFLLGVVLTLLASIGSAQVIVYVEPPSVNEGSYDFTFADPASGWGVPDLTDPLNAVTDTLVFALDATAADSLACGPIVSDVSGKIAVLYRGSCEFGAKALNCQNAGAVAVIIINNIPGAPVGMGAGASGASVTIPVVMISQAAGALLQAEIEIGNTTAFIGSKTGYYGDDIGLYPQHVLRPKQFGNIQALSQDDTEFEVELGAWVVNYGSNDQSNVTLSCTVQLGAAVLYNSTSSPEPTVISGDSAYFALPPFSQSSYANGYYTVTYEINSAAADEFLDDNSTKADFMMSDSLYSYAQIDSMTYHPVAIDYYRGGGTTSSNSSCIAFNDPNASRMAIKGMTFSATTNADQPSIDGEYVEITAYEWNDPFADINDAVVSDISSIASAEYIYSGDFQQTQIFVPFEEPVLLTDSQNYLFCLTFYGDFVFSGFDSEIDYNLNLETYLQPMFPSEADLTWYVGGYGPDVVPALTVNMFTAAVGLVDLPHNEAIAYPNPATSYVNIPLADSYGDITLTITDLSGKVVSRQNVAMEGNMLTVDVTTLATGSYVIDILHNNDQHDVVKINVNR